MKKNYLVSMFSYVLTFLALFLGTASTQVYASPFVIDFEFGQTGNSGHISGDFLTSGVVFTRNSAFDPFPPPIGTGTATAENLTYYKGSTQGFANQSPDYSVAVGGGIDGSTQYGTIRADFFDPNTSLTGLVDGTVSVWFGDASSEIDNVSVQAFDASGIMLSEDTSLINNGGSNTEAFDILAVSGQQIAYVLISSDHPVAMDNFTFDTPVSPVPLPATLPMFLSAIALLSALKVKQKRRSA